MYLPYILLQIILQAGKALDFHNSVPLNSNVETHEFELEKQVMSCVTLEIHGYVLLPVPYFAIKPDPLPLQDSQGCLDFDIFSQNKGSQP